MVGKLDTILEEEPCKKQEQNLMIKEGRMSKKSLVMTHEYPPTLNQIQGSQATSMSTTMYK